MARHGRRLLHLLDDSPVVPGDTRPRYVHGAQARQILNDAEDDLRDWEPEAENIDAGSSVKSPVQSIPEASVGGTTNVGTAATTEGELAVSHGSGAKSESVQSPQPLDGTTVVSPSSSVSGGKGEARMGPPYGELPN